MNSYLAQEFAWFLVIFAISVSLRAYYEGEISRLRALCGELILDLEKIKYGQQNPQSVSDKSWAHKHDSLIDFIDEILAKAKKEMVE